MLGAGADVNGQDNEGLSPLMFAAYKGKKDCVEVLVSHGADVNAKNINGSSPLMWAAREGKKDCVEVLLSHGADVTNWMIQPIKSLLFRMLTSLSRLASRLF